MTVLFLGLALVLLAHALFLLAEGETAVATAAERALRAEYAAEGSLLLAEARAGHGSEAPGALPAEPSGAWIDAAHLSHEPIGLLPAVRGRGRLLWLSREIVLVEGSALTEGSPEPWRMRRVAWRLDPVARVGALQAVVEHGGVFQDLLGGVVGGRVREIPEGWEERCLGYRSVIDSIFPTGILSRHLRLPELRGDPSGPTIGLLDLSDLERSADRRIGPGLVEPADSVLTGVVFVDGPTAFAGVEGNGVLISSGDLRLAEGTRYLGIVLVQGSLQVDGGSTIRGFARVSGDLRVEGGEVVGSACPALHALAEARSLQRLRWPAGGGWIRP